MTTDDVKGYVASRVAELETARIETCDPMLKFQMACKLEELQRFSAWLDVAESGDTHEDREGGCEL